MGGGAAEMAVLLMIPTLREAEALLGPGAARAALEGRGAVGGHPCSLVGMGPVEAAVGAGRAFARHPEVEAGLLIGLGGSFDLGRAPLGALVRAEWFGMEPAPLAFLGERESLGLEGELEPRHPMPGGELPGDLKEFGEGVCVGGFVTVFEPRSRPGAEQQMGAVNAGCAGALVEEMEGYAVARAAWAFGKGLASLRAISNRVGDRELGSWDWEGAFAALHRVIRALEGQER